MQADHQILKKSLEKARNAFVAIANCPQDKKRRKLVMSLSDLLRPLSVHQHHTEREQNQFYPFLEKSLDENTLSTLARALIID